MYTELPICTNILNASKTTFIQLHRSVGSENNNNKKNAKLKQEGPEALNCSLE